MLTGFGRMSLVERVARKLPEPAPLVELDVTDEEHLATLADQVREHVDGSTAWCTRSVSPRRRASAATSWTRPGTTWPPRCRCRRTRSSRWRWPRLPLFGDAGGSIVGLTFDATVAWPAYDWMGVAKAGLESTSRYLARELGPRRIRVNLVAAGPMRTMAAKSIPGFSDVRGRVGRPRAAGLGQQQRRAGRSQGSRRCSRTGCPATTGEIVHVDGGFHAMGV